MYSFVVFGWSFGFIVVCFFLWFLLFFVLDIVTVVSVVIGLDFIVDRKCGSVDPPQNSRRRVMRWIDRKIDR